MQIPSPGGDISGFQDQQGGRSPTSREGDCHDKGSPTQECYGVKSLSWGSELLSQSFTKFIEHARAVSQFNEEGHSVEMGGPAKGKLLKKQRKCYVLHPF